MITDDFEPKNDSVNLSTSSLFGTQANWGVSAVMAKMSDNLRIGMNPILTTATQIDRYSSPLAGISRTMASLVKSPVYEIYSGGMANIAAQQITRNIGHQMATVCGGVTILATPASSGLALGLETNSGLGGTITVIDSIAKKFTMVSNLLSVTDHMGGLTGKATINVSASGLTWDFASKYSTINYMSGVANQPWTHATEMFRATQSLTTIANVTNTLISNNSVLTTGINVMKGFTTGYEVTIGKSISNLLTPYSLAIKPEFDLLKGIGAGILATTMKADYLTRSAGEYLHVNNTIRITPNFEDRLASFGERILARLDRGLYRSVETETEIIERDGKVEYHFHLHLNVTGNFNIIGNSNLQNNYINGHE